MRRQTPALALIAIPCLLAGCAPDKTAKPPSQSVGMPNPASVHCTDQGGKLEIRTGKNGQYGVCHLPDGRQCEEWALFRDKQCVAEPGEDGASLG